MSPDSLELQDLQKTALQEAAERLAVSLTPHLADLIDHTDPDDPIARQFLPRAEELVIHPGERADPIGDEPHSPVKGIVHREPDRVLLKPVHICAVYCRFCFRREQVGPGGETLNAVELQAALDYIRANSGIWEVILSGGDPLILSPRRLRDIIQQISDIPHVAVIRFHTRHPIADPDAITPELIDALKSSKAVWGIIHANHPREITPAVKLALARFVDAGIPLLSQSVLLKGVNDEVEILDSLFRSLIQNRVKPYYLHHADLARGTGHFRTTLLEGQNLMRLLRQQLSGIALPLYMLDIPGGAGKIPVGPIYLTEKGAEDPRGQLHLYPPNENCG